MDKYRLVEEKTVGAEGFISDDEGAKGSKPRSKPDSSSGEEDLSCVVRITQQAKPRSCISTAMDMLNGGRSHVKLTAMGKAINKAVTIAEILKRKMPLHQVTALSSCEVITVYEPLEEGLEQVTNQHYVSCLTITLSRELTGIDVNDIGYQPPLPQEEMQPGDYSTKMGRAVHVATA